MCIDTVQSSELRSKNSSPRRLDGVNEDNDMTKVALMQPFQRETAPQSHREWIRQEEDPEIILQSELANWLKNVSSNETLFKEHVYENNNLTDADLRQHRSRICDLISSGEVLAMGFVFLGQQKKKENEFGVVAQMIDQALKKLLETLFAWHGPLSAQADIPESFKQAAKEVADGKIVDLDI